MQDRAAETKEGARIAAPSSDAGPRLSNRARERIAGYLFVAPDAIGLLIFVGGPMILSLSLGFFSVSGFGEYTFVGLANYRRMMADPLFWRSLEVTVLYVVALWSRRSMSSVLGSRCSSSRTPASTRSCAACCSCRKR